jgi:hypothetical protein
MAEYALPNAPYPGVNTPYQRGTLLPVVLSFASGVPSIVEARSASGFTIAGDTGVYTGTAPTGTRGVFWGQCLMATPDDATVCVKSYNPVTGAFAFDVHNAAGAIDVATGDEVWLFFMVEGG